MSHNDLNEYWQFAQPKVAHKAFNSLKGIIEGIASDGEIHESEVRELDRWSEEHDYLIRSNPFKDLITNVQVVISDNIVTAEEIANLRWLIAKYEDGFTAYDRYTSDLHELQGICHGLLSDGVIKDSEVAALRLWMYQHEHLSTYYPYDEMLSVLTDILADNHIDDDERIYLKRFFMEFVNLRDEELQEQLTKETEAVLIDGICATDPEISFNGKEFCLTGTFSGKSKAEIAAVIEGLGGSVKSSITQGLDYLIVGDDGNPCWAYACYGRKVEKAIEHRKKGQPLVIVHENDFWDAVRDV